jgi:hypothetical protein
MKKHIALFAMVFMMMNTLQAQVYLTLHGGYSYNKFTPGLLNTFVDSYNTYLASYLKTPMEKFDTRMTGIRKGFGMYANFDGMVVGIDFSKVRYRQERLSAYNNGNGRGLDIEFVNWDTQIDIGAALFETGSIGFMMGASIRSGTIYSYAYSWDPEYRSFGPEYWLNGIYKGGLQADINLGISMRIPVTRFARLQIQAYYPLPFADNTEGEEYLSAFSDASAGKNISSEYFPYDLPQSEANINAGIYDYQTNVIPNVFRGVYVNAALMLPIRIGSKKD